MDKLQLKPRDRVVIGDVHGQIHLLTEMLEELRDSQIHLLFLGDLVDRAQQSGDDYKVLALVKSLNEDPSQMGFVSVESLRGNHEEMLLDAIDGYDIPLWIQNGGDVSQLKQLGEFKEWLENRPYFLREEDTVYVHAGLRPGVPLDKQKRDDLVWIRTPFLKAKSLNIDGIKHVIHGHTWHEDAQPICSEFSTGVDTGAFCTGVLTAYHVNDEQFFQVYAEDVPL